MFKIIDNNIPHDCNNLLNTGKWLILIHSEYCPHCINMMKEWNTFKELKPNVNILEIESKYLNNITLPNNINIDGFPTILLWNNNEPTYFNGMRTAQNFTNFINM